MQNAECKVQDDGAEPGISNLRFEIVDVPVALLAGGLATRLRPITQAIPKALVDVGGRPFIDHQLSLLSRHGVRNVVLCLGHLGEQVEDYVGDGSAYGLSVRYSYDGETLVGTAGALRWALPKLGDLFWVMYGDSYMDIDYAAVLNYFAAASSAAPASSNHNPMGLMTVLRNDDQWDRSNVVFENGRLECYDKRNLTPTMQFIDYGVQLLRREALLHLAPGEPADLADIYRDLTAAGRMTGYEVSNRFYEIGTPQSLEEARRVLGSAGTPPAQVRKSA
ncbi:MAG: hddC 1 [Phycisphaerales bacterium]|nr:hddC 1 [Phycisphaerales bacterium]